MTGEGVAVWELSGGYFRGWYCYDCRDGGESMVSDDGERLRRAREAARRHAMKCGQQQGQAPKSQKTASPFSDVGLTLWD